VKALNDALFNFLLYHIENYLVDNIQGVRQTMHCILPEIEEFICNGCFFAFETLASFGDVFTNGPLCMQFRLDNQIGYLLLDTLYR